MSVQVPSTSNKNISSTLNTLRGLEINNSSKKPLSFEKTKSELTLDDSNKA